MRFASFRCKQRKLWLCIVIVKKWRPIYARWNARFAQQDGLVQWIIVEESAFRKWQEDLIYGIHDSRSGVDSVAEIEDALRGAAGPPPSAQ